MDAIKYKTDDAVKFAACYCYQYDGFRLSLLVENNEVLIIEGVKGVWKI